jgi:cytochrome c553
MKTSLIIICTAIFMGTALSVVAGGDPSAGKSKAMICSSCHGVDGNSPDPDINPSVAGMDEDYLYDATKAYTDGRKEHNVMRAMLMNFSDQDIADISAYYANQNADD